MRLEPTLRPMLTQSASRMLRIREVSPSPLSLASQHLQTKLYMTPFVGTMTVSSSSSQQLSGVAPSWPTWESPWENTCWLKGISSEERPSLGVLTRDEDSEWWYIRRRTNYFHSETESAIFAQQARHQCTWQLVWARKLRSSAAEQWGRQDTASPKSKQGRLDWPTWKQVQTVTTLLLLHWPLSASLLTSADPFLLLSNAFHCYCNT